MNHDYEQILVTGGAGFIGSHIVDRLLKEGFKVTVIDSLRTGSLENIAQHQNNKHMRFIEGDIRDLGLVRKAMKDTDAIFHEAAIASPTFSIKDPILTDQINLGGTLSLLKASCDRNVKRFIYASSAAVYGDTKSPEMKEDDLLRPMSPYGVTKLAAENYVRVFQKLYGLETVSLRYFNVYGPRQKADVHGSYGGVISIFINRILKGLPPTVHGDGGQTRDFVYIDDVVEANMQAMTQNNAIGEAFNIATGKNTSINQIAETLKHLMNREDLQNIHTEPRPADRRHGYADITKAKKILGYNPKFPIKEGLTEIVNQHSKKDD